MPALILVLPFSQYSINSASAACTVIDVTVALAILRQPSLFVGGRTAIAADLQELRTLFTRATTWWEWGQRRSEGRFYSVDDVFDVYPADVCAFVKRVTLVGHLTHTIQSTPETTAAPDRPDPPSRFPCLRTMLTEARARSSERTRAIVYTIQSSSYLIVFREQEIWFFDSHPAGGAELVLFEQLDELLAHLWHKAGVPASHIASLTTNLVSPLFVGDIDPAYQCQTTEIWRIKDHGT